MIMQVYDFLKTLKTRDQRLAWLVAMVADSIQIVGLPLFAAGALSPADSILDIVVAGILIRLLGWHWVLLPALAAELIPAVDLIPTWTVAVFYVTRHQVRSDEPEILPPGPAPARRY